MRKSICLLAILFAFVSLYHVHAQESQVLKVAVTHLPPARIVDGENVEGIFIDILEAIFHPMGLKLEYTVAPLKRCLVYLEDGDVDLYIGLYKRPEREAFAYFIEPPFQTKTVKIFYLRKGEGDRVQQYEDLYTLERGIGVRSGFKMFPRFDEDEKIKKQEVTTDEQNLKKLEAERIDAFVQTEEVADYLVVTLGFEEKVDKAPYKYEEPNPVYIAFSKKSPYMRRIQEIEAAVKRFVEAGNAERITREFLQKLSKTVK